jgi:hypothetical protein
MDITLKDIITITGHSGLFTSIKPTRHGLLVESLNDQKKRSIKQLQDHEIATLEDVTIYTTGEKETLSLFTLLWRLRAEFSASIDTHLYNTPGKLHKLMERIAPDYDSKRVYASSIKKIIHWYNLLVKHTPQLFDAEGQATPPDSLG